MNAARTIRLDLAYDGTGFRGWAEQRGHPVRTVEGVLREVLPRTLGHDVRFLVAGRTDAGVHARGQVVSFITTSARRPDQIRSFVNGELAPEVVVLGASVVPEGFHARFWATAREYRYVIDTSAVSDPFRGRYEWHRPRALDVGAMRTGVRHLVGEHDFASFCRHPGAGKSTVRDLQRATVRREGERVVLGFRANAFLHQMVRAMVGTLVRVGDGKLAPEEIGRILAARDRGATATLAPARGLTLERVIYRRRAVLTTPVAPG
ncbi:MAG: tRNA pseudouridine(38-40) synthase TruA [Actinomycetota bacterium]